MKVGGRVVRRFVRVLIGCLLLCLFVFLGYIASNRVFALNNVEVVGAGIDIQVDQHHLPQNLLLFPTHTLEQALQKDYPLLARVRVKKKFPHTLRIEVSLRDPVIELHTAEKVVFVDREGYIVSYDPPLALLPIVGVDVGTVRLGEQVREPRVRAAINFLVASQPFLLIDSITEGEGLSLRVKSGTINIFIPQEGAMAQKATTLQTLMTGFRIKGVLPAVIDLRFDKPIITF